MLRSLLTYRLVVMMLYAGIVHLLRYNFQVPHEHETLPEEGDSVAKIDKQNGYSCLRPLTLYTERGLKGQACRCYQKGQQYSWLIFTTAAASLQLTCLRLVNRLLSVGCCCDP